MEQPSLLAEIAKALSANDARLVGNCAEVLTKVADGKRDQVVPCVEDILPLLAARNTRVRWEAMHGIALVPRLMPENIGGFGQGGGCLSNSSSTGGISGRPVPYSQEPRGVLPGEEADPKRLASTASPHPFPFLIGGRLYSPDGRLAGSRAVAGAATPELALLDGIASSLTVAR